MSAWRERAIAAVLSVGLGACGGGGGGAAPVVTSFTVGGMVAGLSGSGLILKNNGGDDAAISASGSINAGRRLKDGRIVLGTQAGELWVSSDSGSSYHRAAISGPQPISDLVETPQGLVIVGPRGVAHVALP